MTHDEIEFLIVQRLDGTLDAAEEQTLTRVLAENPDARALLAQHERLLNALRAAPAVPEIDHEWMSAQIASAIDDAEEARRHHYRIPRLAIFGPMAAAAALLITLTLGVVFHRDDGDPIPVANSNNRPVAVAQIALPLSEPVSTQPRQIAVSVGAPANLSPQLVTALFLAEQLPSAGHVDVRPAGPRASAFE